MKKGVIAGLLILVVIIIVSPAIVGKLAENSVDKNLDWAVDQSAELVVTSDGFDRGWFSSEGQHRVELGNGSIRAAMSEFGADDAPVLIIKTRLDHGIIPVTSMTRAEGSLAPGLGSAVSTLTVQHGDGESFDLPGAIYSKIDLGGNLRSSYLLEAGSHESEDGTVSWQPGKITISADPKSGGIEFEGDFGALTVTDAEHAMTFDGLTFSGEQEKTEYGFFVGELDMAAGEVSADMGGNSTGGLKGLTVNASSSVDDGVFNSTALLNIDSQNTPGFGESSVNVKLSLTGADAAAWGVAMKRLEEVSGTSDPTQMLMMAEEDLRGVFASGFVFDLDQLDVALPMGTVETKMNIDIPKSDVSDFEWTSLFLSTVASFDAKVPEALVDMAVQMSPEAGMVIGMGYLKKNGDIYEMNAALKQGLLTLNGAPIPIPLGAFQ